MDSILPVVSIGLPTFNRPNQLESAVENLLSQSYKNIEIIISDNCSTDLAVQEVASNYAKQYSHVKSFRQANNIGPMANFAFVLEQSIGDYFMWAADDDWHSPNFISDCLEKHFSDEYVVVFPKWEIINKKHSSFLSQQVLTPDYRFVEGENAYVRLKEYVLLPDHTHKANVIYGLWKSKCLKNIFQISNAFNADAAYFGLDVAVISRALLIGSCGFVDKLLFYKKYDGHPPGSYYSIVVDICTKKIFRNILHYIGHKSLRVADRHFAIKILAVLYLFLNVESEGNQQEIMKIILEKGRMYCSSGINENEIIEEANAILSKIE